MPLPAGAPPEPPCTAASRPEADPALDPAASPGILPGRRVAIIQDWLTGRRGAEKVLEEMLRLLPQADLFTLIWRKGTVPLVEAHGRRITASLLDRIPIVRRYFQAFLPLFNLLARRFDLRGYDLVLSSSHCMAKNVVAPRGVPHLCFCHTPARYAWDLFDLYTDRFLRRGPGRLLRPLAIWLRDRWRAQDRAGSRGVTRFIAISAFIRDRIRRCYDRDAEVIHSPADTRDFQTRCARYTPGDRFLVISAVRANKRVPEIVDAFRTLQLPLDVVGDGAPRTLRRLRQRGGPTVRVHGAVSDEALFRLVGECRALVHAATEDFGLVPVEAMAAGRPVIGFRHCGVGETVIDQEGPERTGVLFDDPTAQGIAAGVRRFLAVEHAIRPEACRQQAERFGVPRFRRQLQAAIERVLEEAAGETARGEAEPADDATARPAAERATQTAASPAEGAPC